ncbi:hypothetical protein WP50_04130, partial [Lactiplantibacillus plantarum]
MVLVDPASLALRQELMKVGIEAGKADNNGHDHVGNSKGIEVGIQRQQSLITDGQFVLVDTPDRAAAKYRYHLADLNPPAPQDPIIKFF